jgi:hypothetical protein
LKTASAGAFKSRKVQKQTEPPFLATQIISLLAFLILGTLATKRFRESSLARVDA